MFSIVIARHNQHDAIEYMEDLLNREDNFDSIVLPPALEDELMDLYKEKGYSGDLSMEDD